MKLPLAWIGKPSLTLTEHKKAVFGDLVPAYRYTYLGHTKPQWKPLQITKRRQAS